MEEEEIGEKRWILRKDGGKLHTDADLKMPDRPMLYL